MEVILSSFIASICFNILEKNAWPFFLHVDSNSPCQDLRFLHALNLVQKLVHIVMPLLCCYEVRML